MSRNINKTLVTNADWIEFKIDDRRFLLTALIFNEDGFQLQLNKSSIIHTALHHDIFNWHVSGEITINNKQEALERFTTGGVDEGLAGSTTDNTKNASMFRFRGDGRDFLLFRLFPEINPDKIWEDVQSINLLKDYALDWLFVITDTQDITDLHPDGKYKRLMLHEYEYQLAKEKHTYYSTAIDIKRKYGINVTQLSNKNRRLYTGDIIKNLLQFYLYDDTDVIVNIDEENWTRGDSKLFYSSPRQFKGQDDIEYIMHCHIAEEQYNNDICIIDRQRYTKEWRLRPISKLFDAAYDKSNDEAKELHLERFLISRQANNDGITIIPAKQKSPTSGTLFLPDLSSITNYCFEPAAGFDQQQHVLTRVVNAHNERQKQFNSYFEVTDFETTKDFVHTEYNSKMKGVDGDPVTIWPENQWRKDNHNIKHQITNYDDYIGVLAHGRNINVKNYMFLNQIVNFTVPGLTLRQPGIFISIDRNDDYIENEYDNRFLGIYFIVRVDHVLHNETYVNQVTAIKTYLSRETLMNIHTP